MVFLLWHKGELSEGHCFRVKKLGDNELFLEITQDQK